MMRPVLLPRFICLRILGDTADNLLTNNTRFILEFFVKGNIMNEMNRFGQKIKDARNALRLSQEQVSRHVNDITANNGGSIKLPQVTLSAWETGRQKPSYRDDKRMLIINALAQVLEIEVEELEEMLKKDEDDSNRRQPEGMDEEKYRSEMEDYMVNHGYEVDLWFIGPNTLPVTHSESIREAWIDYISQGASYNILWFLDQVSDLGNFRKLFNVMCDIGKKVSDKSEQIQNEPGKIRHFATWLFNGKEASEIDSFESAVATNRKHMGEKILDAEEVYHEIREKLQSGELELPHNLVQCPVALSRDLRAEIQLYWQSLGALVLFNPHGIISDPILSFGLQGTRNTQSESMASHYLYVFLRSEVTNKLKRLVERVRSQYIQQLENKEK